MKTLAQLNQLGFTSVVDENQSTTLLKSKKPFWYFDPRVESCVSGVLKDLNARSEVEKQGIVELKVDRVIYENDEFPYVILDMDNLEALHGLGKQEDNLKAAVTAATAAQDFNHRMTQQFMLGLIGTWFLQD